MLNAHLPCLDYRTFHFWRYADLLCFFFFVYAYATQEVGLLRKMFQIADEPATCVCSTPAHNITVVLVAKRLPSEQESAGSSLGSN